MARPRKLRGPCTEPSCEHRAPILEHVAGSGRCLAAYHRQRRAECVAVRVPQALYEAGESAARAEGITPSEWWRRAGERALAK